MNTVDYRTNRSDTPQPGSAHRRSPSTSGIIASE
ncbi:hypothetical protein V6Z12_D01G151700 [Gossypium hirsutum]